MNRFKVGLTLVAACGAALALVPSAFAHHARISAGVGCDGVVSYTASAWQTSNAAARTHNDVRVYAVAVNGSTLSSPQQVGAGKFNSGNDFRFSGSFPLPSGASSVKLQVKEIGNWANGSASSNGSDAGSTITVARPTSGCSPQPQQCAKPANGQVESSSSIGTANGTATVSFTVAANCSNVKLSLVSYKAPGPAFDERTADQQTVHDSKTVTLGPGNHTLSVAMPDCYYQVDFVYGDVITRLGPAGTSNFYSKQGRLIRALNGGTRACTTQAPAPAPVDQCPNIAGTQESVPSGMTKDSSGNCVTPSSTSTTTTPPATTTTTAAPQPAPVEQHQQQQQAAAPATVQTAPVVTPAAQPAAPKPTVKQPVRKTAKKKVVKKLKPKAKKKSGVKGVSVIKKQVTASGKRPRVLPFTP